MDFVVRVRINPIVSCVAIRYQVSNLSDQVAIEKIVNCFQQSIFTNFEQDNEQYSIENKAEENIDLAKMAGELVGEIFGEAIGHALLGSLGAFLLSGLMGKAGETLAQSVSRKIADIVGLIEHLEKQMTSQDQQTASHVAFDLT
jgi:hypothetical protein